MRVLYKDRRVERQCTDFRQAKRAFPEKVAVKLMQRINFLESAENLESVICNPVLHFHDLKGDREGLYAIDIDGRKGSYRLITRVDDFSKQQVFEIPNQIEIITVTEVSKHYE